MRLALATVATLLALLGAGAASARASGKAVLDDCTDDERMSTTYSQSDYRDALDGLAADADQYGNCRDVIRRAMVAAAGTGKTATPKKHSGSGDSSSTGDGAIGSAPAEEQLRSATAKERSAVDRARNDAAAPLTVNDAPVDPAKVGRVPGMNQVSNLPAPIVVLLALLLAGLLALLAVRIRSVVRARRA